MGAQLLPWLEAERWTMSWASCCQVFRCPSLRLSFLCLFISYFQKNDGPVCSRYSLPCLLLFLKCLISVFYMTRTVRQSGYCDRQDRQTPGLWGSHSRSGLASLLPAGQMDPTAYSHKVQELKMVFASSNISLNQKENSWLHVTIIWISNFCVHK